MQGKSAFGNPLEKPFAVEDGEPFCRSGKKSGILRPGRKLALRRNSFPMMPVQRWTPNLFHAALGAFAAYLVFWWAEPGAHGRFLPIVCCLGLTVAASGMGLRRVRRNTVSQGRKPAESASREGAMESDPQAGLRKEAVDAAAVGHEIKNYLCAIRGNASLLRERMQGRNRTILENRVIIDRIDRVVEKLETFTRDLSVPSAGAASMRQSRTFGLGALAMQCASLHFQARIESFRWNGPDGSDRVHGDPDRMDQVFLNLYTNAFEAGAGRVITSMVRSGDRLLVRVDDDGRGCAAEDLPRVFEPFFSTKSDTIRRGLGMFIVRSIVETHGGRIHGQSKNRPGANDHGLVLFLDLPLAVPERIGAGGARMDLPKAGPVSGNRLMAHPEAG